MSRRSTWGEEEFTNELWSTVREVASQWATGCSKYNYANVTVSESTVCNFSHYQRRETEVLHHRLKMTNYSFSLTFFKLNLKLPAWTVVNIQQHKQSNLYWLMKWLVYKVDMLCNKWAKHWYVL